MKQNLGKLTQVSGNIYTDSHNRTVYVPKGSSVGYVINKEDSNMAELLDKRLLLVSLSVLLSSILVKWWIAVIIGVLVLAVSEIYLIKFFLPKQIKVEGIPSITKEEEQKSELQGKQAKYKEKIKHYSIILIIASLLTLSGLLLFKKPTNTQIYILTVTTIMMLMSFVVEIVYMVLYFIERKKDKK